MITALIAGLLLFQQGPLTTPIVEPKPPVKTKTASTKKVSKQAAGKPGPTKKVAKKPAVIGEKPAQAKAPVVVQHDFVDRPAGSGEPAKAGDIVTVNFLVRRGNLDVADSQKRGLPYTFKIGEKGNDPLLDLVVKGMKVGGTRIAKVAAKDVYGPAGAPPIISGKDMLTVTVNLLSRGAR